MEEFSGKVAVVTGGASGVGLALAHRFAARGMSVVLADVDPDALAAAAAGLGPDVLGVPTEVSDAGQVEALAQVTFDRFGTAHVETGR